MVDVWPLGNEEQLADPIQQDQLAAIRECLNRQRPFGKLEWQAEIAANFGLGSTLRPRGRPRSEEKSCLSSCDYPRLTSLAAAGWRMIVRLFRDSA